MYGKLCIFIFAAWAGTANGGVIAGLSMCGVVLAGTSQASTLMQDFRTGYYTLASPQALFCVQPLGALLGVVVSPGTIGGVSGRPKLQCSCEWCPGNALVASLPGNGRQLAAQQGKRPSAAARNRKLMRRPKVRRRCQEPARSSQHNRAKGHLPLPGMQSPRCSCGRAGQNFIRRDTPACQTTGAFSTLTIRPQRV